MTSIDKIFEQFLKDMARSPFYFSEKKEYRYILQFLLILLSNKLIPESGYIRKHYINRYLKQFSYWVDKLPIKSGLFSVSVNQTKIEQNRSEEELKILLLKHIQKEYESGLNQKVYHEIFNRALIIRQLNRRFNSFCNQSDPVFFYGLADYIKYIFNNSFIHPLIRESFWSKEEDEGYSTSVKGAFLFSLLVYAIVFDRHKIRHCLYDQTELRNFFDENILELYKKLKGIKHNEHRFMRCCYESYITRLHNYLLELLEIPEQQKNQEHEAFYTFNSFGMACGELRLPGHSPLQFTRKPAVILQFFYLGRLYNNYHTYIDYNKFAERVDWQINSNTFRLIINSINRRICKHTGNLIRELIARRDSTNKVNEINCYRWSIV